MAELRIRTCRELDRADLLRLWEECGLGAWNPDLGETINLKVAHSLEGLFVGLIEDRLVASILAGYDGLRGWLYRLAVSPDCRRRGNGRRMVLHAEEWLRQQGCVKVKLQVEDAGQEAVSFYERLGYNVQPLVSMFRRLDEHS
jgi:ribosomal protein S18 acetylase RimI-like enzyme